MFCEEYRSSHRTHLFTRCPQSKAVLVSVLCSSRTTGLWGHLSCLRELRLLDLAPVCAVEVKRRFVFPKLSVCLLSFIKQIKAFCTVASVFRLSDAERHKSFTEGQALE